MSWNGVKKIVIITAIILGLIIVFAVAKITVESVGISIPSSRVAVERIIKRAYPDYEIVNLDLQYVDFYSTIRKADEFNNATMAEAVVRNNEEQRTLKFKKILLFFWIKTGDVPDYGSNVPKDFFVEENYMAIGSAVNIEEHIEKNKIWVIPNKDGSIYTISGDDISWYYSVHYYKNIYKCENGKVYSYNKYKSEWEESTKTYSDLNYYANFRRVDEKTITDIVNKYSSNY